MSMTTNEIRKIFLDFFEKKSHAVVESSSLIPENDPTLLFINAGMNQFKNVFLGQETRAYTRATSSQRCMRVSGKHNDLEMVGYTARHHTFFEMLGNFSFGDYFKREAINYAWEFLTKKLELPQNKLWITVYKDDKEAENIWLNELKIDPSRFSRCGKKDNFWSMGDTGPCGPCSEIFYDHGPSIEGGPPGSQDEEGDRYVEIWNLVFMQYNRHKDGTLTPLPKPSVDTGMGLERISAALQGVHNNYEIDLFKNLISAICTIINVKDEKIKGVQVIADHIRAATFLVADGIIPSNEGRGYVLRRIVRRAIRHAYKLGVNTPFFHKLVTPLVNEMKEGYPYLINAKSLVEQILKKEEEQFAATLEQGLGILEQEISKLSGNTIPGEVAFRLYDTYGFPLDLTADIAREHSLQIEEEGFNIKMAAQRSNSKQASKFTSEYTQALEITGKTEFVGYTDTSYKTKIAALFKKGNKEAALTEQAEATIALVHSPFYAEAGGQVGDKGKIYNDAGCFQVSDTKKQGAVYLHHGKLINGTLKNGDVVIAEVEQTRLQIARNHSATHLLHAALRQVLGKHVEQKGSLVDATRLRFDFSHFEALTDKQIAEIERTVNLKIRSNLPVEIKFMSQKEAEEQGAMALFTEKYTDNVRVIKMGDFSQELCGGTHVKATGEIALFKIIAETGIAAGIRRIEAITGEVAFEYFLKSEKQLTNIAHLLKTDKQKLTERLQHLIQETKQQEKKICKIKTQLASNMVDTLIQNATELADIKLIIANLPEYDKQEMRTIMDMLKQKAENLVIILTTVIDCKEQLVIGVSKNCCDKINANNLLKQIVNRTGGKGGGRPDMAQGGGGDPKLLETALQKTKKWIAEKLK